MEHADLGQVPRVVPDGDPFTHERGQRQREVPQSVTADAGSCCTFRGVTTVSKSRSSASNESGSRGNHPPAAQRVADPGAPGAVGVSAGEAGQDPAGLGEPGPPPPRRATGLTGLPSPCR